MIAIIQARNTSTRLRGKVLLPLGDTTVLDYVVTRACCIKGLREVIVAIPDTGSEDIFNWCKENGIRCFRGSEDNVLQRYVHCARLYNVKYIMRITADCPFIDYETASKMVSIMQSEEGDIMTCSEEKPRGLAVEIISKSALETIYSADDLEDRHREHVTYYAYEYLDKFKEVTYKVDKVPLHNEMRITLDTIQDYLMLSELAELAGSPTVPTKEVIKILEDNPQLRNINKDVRQKPVI